MGKFKIDPEVKEQIINRIKNEGVSVVEASKGHAGGVLLLFGNVWRFLFGNFYSSPPPYTTPT